MTRNFKEYTDTELIEIICEKNRDSERAFMEIYHRYSGKIHAYCMRVLSNPDAAEDAFQETFIKFYKNIKKEHSNQNIPGFLVTIARNTCLNSKRNVKETVPLSEESYALVYTPNYESTNMLNHLKNSLEMLPDEFREPFVMREYNGMEYGEIAKVLNITEGNVKTRVYRARQKLKKLMAPHLKEYYDN